MNIYSSFIFYIYLFAILGLSCGRWYLDCGMQTPEL